MNTNDIYLSDETKEYYSTDFKENVLNETDSFWRPNDEIVPFLKRLNDCSTIQPIYCDYPKSDGFGMTDISYLRFAYRKEIEEKLRNEVLPNIISQFEDLENISYEFCKPKENRCYSETSRLGCRNNPNYFMINHIEIYLTHDWPETHSKLWNYMTTKLAELK